MAPRSASLELLEAHNVSGLKCIEMFISMDRIYYVYNRYARQLAQIERASRAFLLLKRWNHLCKPNVQILKQFSGETVSETLVFV